MNYGSSNPRKLINRFDLFEDSSPESHQSVLEEEKGSPLYDDENLSRNFVNRGNFDETY